jgi:hypothetical protein
MTGCGSRIPGVESPRPVNGAAPPRRPAPGAGGVSTDAIRRLPAALVCGPLRCQTERSGMEISIDLVPPESDAPAWLARPPRSVA